MSELKFTKGPWRVLEHSGVYVLDEGGLTIADITYQLPDRDGETERLANARLISAAPELLDALCALVLNIDAGGATLGAVADARAVIAKATVEKQS